MEQKQHFSFSTVKDFDEHISTSISGYDGLLKLIPSISKYFIEDNSNVYDIGCSTGKLLFDLSTLYGKDISFVGYDIEPNLLPLSKGSVQFYQRDVTDPNIKFFNTSFILSLFTLQFIGRVKRRILVDKIFDSLSPGGAFVVAEKYYSNDGQIQEIFNFSAYDEKRKVFTDTEILDKQDTLRKIMRPLSYSQNIEELKRAGFKIVAPIWLSLNFVCYICIKE